jgi:hypothetical protein
MMNASPRLLFATSILVSAITGVLSASPASAEPVTYTGFTITDGKLGTWAFHNARVYLTLQSDTTDVRFVQYPDVVDPTQGTIDAYINTIGTASVTIVTEGMVEHATFNAGQIFVSLDLGQTNRTHRAGGRGVGFGMVSPTSPGGVEPVYPFGINEGTIHWGLINNPGFVYPGTPSPELVALSMDLQHDASYSGNAWSCVGFPNACGAAKPLHTDKGDFYLYTPYWKTYGQKTPPVAQGQGAPSLNAGFFMTKVGTSVARPISYHGYVIADATLGGVRYAGAQVFLSFDGDAGSAVAFHSGASSYGFINRTGEARVSIVSGGRTISATFEPGQIYVYYDVGRSGIGFGSGVGWRGYPLTVTAKPNDIVYYVGSDLVSYTTADAVSQMIRTPSLSSMYSPETATLATDLTNATVISGEASSCVAFDPATSYCTNYTPVALKTNHGDFYLYEPYRDDAASNGKAVFSVNIGMFWSEVGLPPGEF